MKYSVGYQLRQSSDLLEAILAWKDQIHEVYFAWGDFANGRNRQQNRTDMTPWEALARQEEDLVRLSAQGIRFNLLFNAMCYGRDSQSRAFFDKVGETVDYLENKIGLQSITTTSLLIARFIKENFKELDVRASVNMSIGTIEGMDYVKDCFDSFYLKREYNRDFCKIKELKKWCDENGKVLYALANSGCLNHCSAHVFHDNLVAHESEIAAMDNGYAFEGICRTYLKKEGNARALLERTNFIRPEDISLYEGLFPAMKLATRVSSCPVKILKAYLEDHRYSGSTLELLEPNHTGLFYPYLLENRKIERELSDGKLSYTNWENAFMNIESIYDTDRKHT